jgi:FlaA1/EpsC-like NDP-sugar epimerase
MVHLIPFSILFFIWIIVFYAAGLYERHTLIFRNNLPNILFNTQIFNTIVAVVFFYFLPFSTNPKTILFIYLIVSVALIFYWRLGLFSKITPHKKQNALLIGVGQEIQELYHEVNKNKHYNFRFFEKIDLDKD